MIQGAMPRTSSSTQASSPVEQTVQNQAPVQAGRVLDPMDIAKTAGAPGARAHTYMQTTSATMPSGVAKYVDVVLTMGAQTQKNYAALHIPTIGYFDFNFCSGTADVGTPPASLSPYYFGNVGPAPDCSTFSKLDFYAQDSNGTNAWTRVFGSGTPQYGKNTPGVYEQHMINPSIGGAQTGLVAAVEARERQFSTPDKYVFLDDVTTPAEYASYGTLCNGLNRSGSEHDCNSAPGGVTNTSSFNVTTWTNGMIAAVNAVAKSSGQLAIVNGLGGQMFDITKPPIPRAGAAVVKGATGAFGGVCEACFYQSNKHGLYPAVLQEADELVAAHKVEIFQNDNATTPASRMTALAGILQVYDYNYVYEGNTQCGGTSEAGVCPEVAFVAWNPKNHYALSSTGISGSSIYRRDYANCANPADPQNTKLTENGCSAFLNEHGTSQTITSYNGSTAPIVVLTVSSKGSFCGCDGNVQGTLSGVVTKLPYSLGAGQGIVVLDYH